MASIMRQLVVAVIVVSSMIFCLVGQAVCEEGANEQTQSEQVQSNQPSTKLADSQMPNIFLNFLGWPAFSSLQPFFKPVQGVLEKPTQQISDMVGQLPMAQQIFTQLDNAGNQLTSAINPTQMLGNLPGMGRRR